MTLGVSDLLPRAVGMTHKCFGQQKASAIQMGDVSAKPVLPGDEKQAKVWLSNGEVSSTCSPEEELPLEAGDLQVLGDPAWAVSHKADSGLSQSAVSPKGKEPCRSWAFRMKSS